MDSKGFTIDVNKEDLEEFYAASKFLSKKPLCKSKSYNKSAPFQYMMMKFNDELPGNIRKQKALLKQYVSRRKKDVEIRFCVREKILLEFKKGCAKVKLTERDCIRALMLVTIEEANFYKEQMEAIS